MYGRIFSQTLTKGLHKLDIYKVDSHATDTFFVHLMKILPKKSLCKVNAGLEKQ